MSSPPPRHHMNATIALIITALVGVELTIAKWGYGLSCARMATQTVVCASIFVPLIVGLAAYVSARLRHLATLSSYAREGDGAAAHHSAARAVFSLPPLLAIVVTASAATAALAKAIVDVTLLDLPARVGVGLAVGAFALAAVGGAFCYVLARRWLSPLLASLVCTEVPQGPRVSVVAKISVMLAIITFGTIAPFAIFHYAQVTRYEGSARDADRLQLLQAAASAARLGGEARLRSLIDSEAPRVSAFPIALMFLGLSPLLLALFAGWILGRAIVDDVRLVTASVDQVLERGPEEQRPIRARSPQLKEPDSLVSALNALLLRVAELNVSNFMMIERIIEADHVKTQFLANMSHDLRSPLNSTLGFSELLLKSEEGELKEGQRSSLQVIHRNARHLLHLINEVLDFAKLEAGKLVAHEEEVLVASLFSSAVKHTRERGYLRDLEVEAEIQAGLPPLWADGERLSEALVYILRFSARIAKRGPLKAACHLRRGAERQRLEIVVSGVSEGIPAELQRTLFDGFRRYPGHPGLGLGLPLARAFIELHGGQLDIESSEQSNRFVASLPAMERRAKQRQ